MCLNKNIKFFFGIFMCGILVFLLVFCLDDFLVIGLFLFLEVFEGKVNVFFFFYKGSDYEFFVICLGIVVDEIIMGFFWVLVFLGNDKDVIFLEVV